MGTAQYDPAELGRRAWNAGWKVGVKKPLKQRQSWAISFLPRQRGGMRDRSLFDLTIDSKLRGCDLVKIKIGTLVTGQERSEPAPWLSIRNQDVLYSSRSRRTSGQVCLRGVNEEAAPSMTSLFPVGSIMPIISALGQMSGSLRLGYAREDYGTHSLRRTKAAMIYKATRNLRTIQILLGHTEIENTVRYPGGDIEDALELAEHNEI